MKPEMTPEEIVYYCTYYCKKNNINPEFFSVFNNAIVVRDPGCNDLSKPGFALAYSVTNNTVALAKIGNTWQPIVGNTPRIIKVDTVKDLETFLKFIGSLNKYCKEHYCDYNTAISDAKKDMSAKSSTNPNQEITYRKAKKQIMFSESHNSYKLTLDEIFSAFIEKKENFDEFAKESFEFCEENECSLKNYNDNIAGDMLKFKYSLSEYTKIKPKEKLLYTFFDKDSKTGFAYYGDNSIKAFKTIDDEPFYFKICNKPSSLLKSNKEFEAYIKTKKASINEEIEEKIKQYREQQELKGFAGANSEFASHGHGIA